MAANQLIHPGLADAQRGSYSQAGSCWECFWSLWGFCYSLSSPQPAPARWCFIPHYFSVKQHHEEIFFSPSHTNSACITLLAWNSLGWEGPAMNRDSLNLLRALSRLSLNSFRDGASTSLDSLCQGFITLIAKILFWNNFINKFWDKLTKLQGLAISAAPIPIL